MKYYLGKNEFIRMTDKDLAKVMRGLLHVHGQLISADISPVWGQANLVVFRVLIPEGKEVEFEKYTGWTLTSI